MDKSEYDFDCIAMAIVNHTNEINKVDVSTRQRNNDICFDFAKDKIKEFIIGIDMSSKESWTAYSTPPINK